MDRDDLDPGEQNSLGMPQRLRLLVDLYAVEHGAEPTYSEISGHLEAHGVSLSRARWSYMLNGHREVTDQQLLAAIADFFGVQPDFLLNDGPLPERVESQLELIRAMRIARVRSFAARTLGDVSPQTLNAITRFLDEEAAGRTQER
ncbi:hypothetical protein [Brachybacterium atlanticum]|uniref:hypothetical protein n=1 Tax=Brachybacterium atlanticum TaxID=2911888 RepID=UPI0021E007DC|nr:hypothetical protein [Brachybacterium atlanticum]